jgi:hypothetical protein
VCLDLVHQFVAKLRIVQAVDISLDQVTEELEELGVIAFGMVDVRLWNMGLEELQ